MRRFLPYGLLLATALLVRFIDLGDRPFHHDESQDAYFSWVFFDRGDYAYQPILHGPLRFYLTALMYVVFGDSDFTARLAPALMGVGIVFLPFLLRRQLGTMATWTAALMLAFGPTYLYFSRFAREDIYIACINMALLVVTFRMIDKPRRWHPAAIGALLALAFGTKETTFITGFVFVTFLIPAACFKGAREKLIGVVKSVGWESIAYGVAAFWLVFALLFTVFFTNPNGLVDGISDGLSYWLGQHEVGRGGEPWYFYFAVLFGHEWPVLALALVGAVYAFKRKEMLPLFLVWAFLVSMIVYSWAGEKFSWLAMHPLMPLLLLAGIGVQWIWSARRNVVRYGGVALVALGCAYSVYASYLANAVHRADPKEFLVSTQSSEDVRNVAQRVYDIDARVFKRTGKRLTVNIDSSEGATFPWAWYFRDLGVGYIDMKQPGYVPQTQVLVMTDGAKAVLDPNLAAYEGQQFRFRVWWVRDWKKKFSAEAWLNWFVKRETWNPVGGMPEWVYVRRDAEAS